MQGELHFSYSTVSGTLIYFLTTRERGKGIAPDGGQNLELSTEHTLFDQQNTLSLTAAEVDHTVY